LPVEQPAKPAEEVSAQPKEPVNAENEDLFDDELDEFDEADKQVDKEKVIEKAEEEFGDLLLQWLKMGDKSKNKQ